MTDQRDSLAREIDEELRREQLLKLWEQYGTYIIAAAVLIIAGIGGWHEHRRIQAAEAAGARFHRRGPGSGARQEGRGAEGSGGGRQQRALRLFRARALCGGRGRPRGRQNGASGSRVRGNRQESGLDPLLADYAQLQAAMLRLDSASWTEMQNRLNDLAAESNPWRFSARELLGLAAQKAGRPTRRARSSSAPERSQYAAEHRRAGPCDAGHADRGGAGKCRARSWQRIGSGAEGAGACGLRQGESKSKSASQGIEMRRGRRRLERA
jgi:hypothetical protein